MLARDIFFYFFMLSLFKRYSFAWAADILEGVSFEWVEVRDVRDRSGIWSDFMNDSFKGIPGDSTSLSKWSPVLQRFFRVKMIVYSFE